MPRAEERHLIRLAYLLGLYPAWLAMMALHECGHILHAAATGGSVAHVSIPLLGFSYTAFSSNPAPGFVAWGGPIWGAVLPVLIWLATGRVGRRVHSGAAFFAGFCLIANGAYLGVGGFARIGDAETLLHTGTHPVAMYAFGLIATVSGLWIWHDLGRNPGRGQ